MIRFLATALFALAVAGCSDGSTPLLVTNQSSVELHAVQANGPGFAAYVGDLAPGESRKIKIYPRGEAGLGLNFTANNHQITSPVSGYFESGYKVSVVVSQDLSVTVDGELY